jgi:Tfp pilus assembly protein PilN
MTIKVDLLDKPGRKSGFDPVLLFLIVIVVFSIGGFYFWGSTLDREIAKKKAEITEIDDKIAKLEDKIPEITKLEELNKELENQINVIKELVYDPIRYANILDEIAYIMPSNIYVNSLSIEPTDKSISFSGSSLELPKQQPLDQISKFMQNLQKSKYFKNATLSNTNHTTIEGKEAYTFSIRVEYDPEAAAQE